MAKGDKIGEKVHNTMSKKFGEILGEVETSKIQKVYLQEEMVNTEGGTQEAPGSRNQ